MNVLFSFAAVRRRLLASLLLTVLGASLAGSVWAGGGHGAGRVRAAPAMRSAPAAAPRAMRGDRGAAAARASQAREQSAPQAVPQAPPERPAETPAVDRNGRPGRLTPEERRALRQQINDAGRDIYRAPPPVFPP